jgi:hypothetical protein
MILVPAEILVLCTLPMVQAPQQLLVTGAITMFFAVVGLVSINLGAGAYYATLREDNPVRVAASQGASVTFLVSLLFLLGIAVMLAVPLVRVLAVAASPLANAKMWLSLGIVGCISLVVAVLAHVIGIHALRKDF